MTSKIIFFAALSALSIVPAGLESLKGLEIVSLYVHHHGGLGNFIREAERAKQENTRNLMGALQPLFRGSERREIIVYSTQRGEVLG